jgi:hypothetical protein
MFKQILKVPLYAIAGVIIAVGLTGYGIAKVVKPSKAKKVEPVKATA